MGASSFCREYARLLEPMNNLIRFRTIPYINNFIKKQIEIDVMALKLGRTDTRNNDEEKLKKAFLKTREFIYGALLPAMGYGDIQPLVPIVDPESDSPSSMDIYSKKN